METIVATAANAAGSIQGSVEVLTTPTVLFHSDWSTGTGTSVAALRDTDKSVPWTTMVNQNGLDISPDNGPQLEVVPNTLFPNQSFTNMFRSHCYGKSSKVKLKMDSIPAIGEHRYYRYYLYSDIAVSEETFSFSGHHPQEIQFDNADEEIVISQWGHTQGTNVMDTWNFTWRSGGPPLNSWPNLRFELKPGTDMLFRTVYRVEFHIERTGALTHLLDVRIYDGGDPGTRLFENVQFQNIDSSKNLDTWREFLYVNAEQWKGFDMGINGILGTQSHPDDIWGIHYWGGVCIRDDNWCGPYAEGV